MSDEIERIAEGLSEAQRECLDWVKPCSLIAYFREGRDALEEKGLVRTDVNQFVVITPLGRAVRAHLQEQSK